MKTGFTTIPTVTKTPKGNKVVYAADGGVILRTSTRDYKYVLFGLCNTYFNTETKKTEEGPDEWRFVGMGNNAQNLVNSWKSIWHCSKFEVVTIN